MSETTNDANETILVNKSISYMLVELLAREKWRLSAHNFDFMYMTIKCILLKMIYFKM